VHLPIAVPNTVGFEVINLESKENKNIRGWGDEESSRGGDIKYDIFDTL
jgi:hypothetical protein